MATQDRHCSSTVKKETSHIERTLCDSPICIFVLKYVCYKYGIGSVLYYSGEGL